MLWRDRNYRLLWSARAVTDTGAEVTRLALPLTAVTLLGASALQMGLLTAAASLPFLIAGLPAGAMADRVALRRPVMIVCEVVAGLAVLSVPVAYLLGFLSIGWLVGTAIVVGTCSVVFRNFATPYLSSVIPEDQRTAALAGIQGVFAVAQLGGPGLAGVLVAVLTAPLALIVDAATFLVSVVCLRAIRTREPRRPPTETRDLRAEIAEGARTLLRHPVLRALTLAGMTINFFAAAQLAVYVLFAVRVLGLPPSFVGVTTIGFGLGALIGSTVAPRLERRYGRPRLLLASVLVFPMGFIAVAAAHGPVWLSVSIIGAAELVGGVGVVCFSVCASATTMAETPATLFGRVNATTNFATQGVMAIGGLAGGLLGEVLGLREALWVCAAGAFLAIPCLWASPIARSARRHPLPEEPTSTPAQHQ